MWPNPHFPGKLFYKVNIPRVVIPYHTFSKFYIIGSVISYRNICYMKNWTYRNSSNRRLFNFEALRSNGYWSAVPKRGRCLFENRKNYSYQISNLCHVLIQKIANMIYSLLFSELLVVFIFPLFASFFLKYLNLVTVRLWLDF